MKSLIFEQFPYLGESVRIALAAKDDAKSRAVLEETKDNIVRTQPDREVLVEIPKEPVDFLVLLGDDSYFLDSIQEIQTSTPVLCAGEGFLSETDFEGLETTLKRVIEGSFKVEERIRLEAEVAGVLSKPALNDIVLTSTRGGSLVRYTLLLNGERVWRDSGDGVVVATPTGSTGYGLSAGGPIVTEGAGTIALVPICSTLANRPLVLSDADEITLSEIECRRRIHLLIDGREMKAPKGKSLEIRKSKHSVNLVRLGKARVSRVIGKLSELGRPRVFPSDTPPSAKFLYKLLVAEGSMTRGELVTESGLSERTVRSAIAFLIDHGMVVRHTSLRDTRRVVFSLSDRS